MAVDRLIDALRAGRAGAVGLREWSLVVQRSAGWTLGVKDGEVGSPHAPLAITESCEAGYRLIWEDGLVSRGSLERRQLQGDLAEALVYARAAAYDDPDAAWVRGPQPMPEVEMHDAGLAAVAQGDMRVVAERIARLRELVASTGVRTWSGSLSAAEGDSRVVTSAGLDVASRGTTSTYSVTFDGEIGDGFAARRLDSTAEFEARLARLADLWRRLREPGPALPGGTHRVILAPDVVESFVLGTLFENLQGATVAHGEGHFRREQFGSARAVLREDLGLRLDPLEPLRRGTYRCTAEGVPASRCAFIDRGRLVQPVLDLKYSRRLGLEPTPLPMALDTVHLEGAGALAPGAAWSAAAGGVLVLAVLGVHTQDAASGDFSLAAPQALAIGADGPRGRLRGTISGNLFRVLASDDLRLVRFEGEHTPGLLVSCRFDP